ncbi:hypothetical protein [Paenibacillus tianmuensis]|uniref:hypothetical protein n=1 Tax=Paenibacillus tianmuensis TaxID=624147 RepID=UPI001C27A9B4|nr:hypothetical protein [Paenibacillus tianmuensis]
MFNLLKKIRSGGRRRASGGYLLAPASLLSVPIAYTFARLALKYENYGGIVTIVQQTFGEKSGAVIDLFFFLYCYGFRFGRRMALWLRLSVSGSGARCPTARDAHQRARVAGIGLCSSCWC